MYICQPGIEYCSEAELDIRLQTKKLAYYKV